MGHVHPTLLNLLGFQWSQSHHFPQGLYKLTTLPLVLSLQPQHRLYHRVQRRLAVTNTGCAHPQLDQTVHKPTSMEILHPCIAVAA